MFLQRYSTLATRNRHFEAKGGSVYDYDGWRVHVLQYLSNTFEIVRGHIDVEIHLFGPGESGRYGTGGRGGDYLTESRTLSSGVYNVQAGLPGVPMDRYSPGQPMQPTKFEDLEVGHVTTSFGGQYSETYLSHWGERKATWYGGGGGILGNGGDAREWAGGNGGSGKTYNLWGEEFVSGAGGGGGIVSVNGETMNPYNYPGEGGGPRTLRSHNYPRHGTRQAGGKGSNGVRPPSSDWWEIGAARFGNGGGGKGTFRGSDYVVQEWGPGSGSPGLVVVRYRLSDIY